MKRNPFYKTLQALALLLLALATMAGAATGLDTDPDTQELYVNMPVIGLNEVEITADDIANGLTSFMVYDDGGKSGDYSNDAFGHLSLKVPTGYGVLISGTVETEVDLDKLTIYNETVSGSLSLNDENRLFISDEVVPVAFESNGSNANSGFALKVFVVKRSDVQVTILDGGRVYLDKAEAIVGETVTLTISPADGYVYGGLEVKDASNKTVAINVIGTTATFTMPASDVTVIPTWNKLYDVTIENVTGGDVFAVNNQALAGETVTLTMYHYGLYELGGLEVKDASDNSVAVTITGTTATFMMPASDVTVTPTWNLLYVVNISSRTGGEVNSDKEMAVVGETVTLTIAPADGYVYGSLEVKDASNNSVAVTVTGTTATFTMPTSNVYVYPAWNKLYDVTVAKVTGGEVKADEAIVAEGAPVTLTVSPAKDYMLSNLEIKDENQNVVNVTIAASSFSNTASFVMPSANVTVTPTWTKIHSAEGGLFVNMPVSGEQNITIPDGITSFKLYDDGGKDGMYSYNADGYLTVTAPEGYVLQVSGTMKSYNYKGKLSVFDGENSQATPLLNECSKGNKVGTRISTGNVMTFYFQSTSNYSTEVSDGLDLTVNVIKMDLSLAEDGEGGYYVNMLAQYTATLNITADDIANGVTSFNVYDDGGKEGKFSYNADGYLTITAPEGYVLQMSGTVFYNGNGNLSVYDGGNSQATPLLSNVDDKDIGTRISTGNVVTFYFLSTAIVSDYVSKGFELNVQLIKMDLALAKDGEGAYYVNMLAQNTATLNITADDIANGVTSFNIYDDGGVEYDHSWNVDGYLTITVPKDYVLQLTGKAKTRSGGGDRCLLSVFDGNVTASPLLTDFEQGFDDGDIGMVVSSGNVMTIYLKSKWNNQTTAPGLELKATLVRRGFGAVAITKAGDGKFRATIDGTYTGTETLSIPNEIEVDEVDYDRELEVGVPVTAMLPVALPEESSVNADFYTLKKVEQVGDRWQATMTYIGDGKLPQPNTPYAFILKEGETKLEFNLNGKKATVQTGPIQNVCGLDKDCVLDDKGNITDDWFFTGTYAYKVWNGADEENGIEQHPELGLAYAFAATDNPGGAAKGKFGRIVAGAHANPMRCYLRKRDANVKLVKAQQVAAASYVARYSVNYVPETIDVEFVKDDAKGGRTVLHGRMNTVTGEFKMLRDFDLKGRKVNSANKARGAYYGKKVLKK